jgi:CheY-like chemotaxis protein
MGTLVVDVLGFLALMGFLYSVWDFFSRRRAPPPSIVPEHPEPSVPECPAPSRGHDKLQTEPLAGTLPKYMVVNDERVIADVLTHILNTHGYPCISAYGGYRAIEKARQFRPRLILMNVVMPDMNGIDAAICILKEQPECCICIFSGSVQTAEKLEEARSKGYEFNVIPCPIHPSDLMLKLSELGFKPEVAVPRILIVDDERVFPDCFTIILRQFGYECETAYQGREAVEKARQFRPHFILMDIMMPDMNGVDAGLRILKEQPACKIVFMTGGVSNEDLLREGFGDGNYTLFWKPFKPQVLLQTLRDTGLPPPSRPGR